jgi:hypothetical protein
LEKVYAWALFSSIYNILDRKINLERMDNKITLEKFCKVFSDTLRLEHIKVSNLFEYSIGFGVPDGQFKLVNWSISAIPKDLSAHV